MNEISQYEQEFQMMKDYGVMEVKMKIMHLISIATNEHEAIELIKKYVTGEENEYHS